MLCDLLLFIVNKTLDFVMVIFSTQQMGPDFGFAVSNFIQALSSFIFVYSHFIICTQWRHHNRHNEVIDYE